jgi:hypothetical protein
MARLVAGTAVVHTDDIAWFHSMFGWSDLALRILDPVHHGDAVSFQPPAWEKHGRAGGIEVCPGMQLVLLEGVGSSREELAHLLDARVWVQADQRITERRNDQRVATGEVTRSVLEQWLAEEHEFVRARRPWTKADLIMAGTPELTHDPRTEVVVATGPLPA